MFYVDLAVDENLETITYLEKRIVEIQQDLLVSLTFFIWLHV